MIQDIAPHRLSNEYLPDAVPADGDPVLFVRGQELAVRRVEEPRPSFEFPRVGTDVLARDADREADCDAGLGVGRGAECGHAPRTVAPAELTYLFSLGGSSVWLAPDRGAAEPPDGFELVHNRTLRMERRGTHEQMYLAYTAVHLAGWYASNRFCGVCASPTERHGSLRALSCPSCGNLIFPRLNPAVIVCVRDPERDKIVLTRYAAGRYAPIDALVAGFVEIGETIEECVRREVREELGLEVRNITYYKSQPWGVAGDILSGYWCDVDGDPTLHVDASELGRAAWVGPDEIPGQPDDLSLTNEMMCLWRDAHRRP
jgi:NAD+ diphosphatase